MANKKEIVRNLQGVINGMAEDIAAEFVRIGADKAAIAQKIVELGLGDGTENLDELTAKIVAIVNREAPTIKVRVGETKSIDAGYYQGGTIQTDDQPADYELTTGDATPTKELQVLTPPKKPDSEDNYYGFSQVSVQPIPEKYQDITGVTAEASDVKSGKVFVASDGKETQGSMVINEAADATLDMEHKSYNIPEGYHDGLGRVSYEGDKKTVTPTKETQTINPDAGKLLERVSVEPIPDEYGDATEADATASEVLYGKKAVVNVDGVATLVEGTMPNNGSLELTFNPLVQDSARIPQGYSESGHVGLTEDLLVALRNI